MNYENRQRILIKKIQEIVGNQWKVKAEYSTNNNDDKIIVVQETIGQKVLFYSEQEPLYNYYLIEIFGNSIQECKELSTKLGYLIGQNILVQDLVKWQIMFKQVSNPQAIAYEDIRRIGYTMTIQCIINPIEEEIKL